MRRFLYLLIIAGQLYSCKSVQNQVIKSPVFSKSHTGFYLYDIAGEKVLADINGDKYFTPASNTKTFTLFTSLNIIGDSIPGIRFINRNDSLIVWGTGDPSLLNPKLPTSSVAEFFSKKDTIYFSEGNFFDERFGPGWSWDDFSYSYQPEKSSLPVYGNLVNFKKDSLEKNIRIEPGFFEPYVSYSAGLNRFGEIERRGNGNSFNIEFDDDGAIDRNVPFKYSADLAAKLLHDTLKAPVFISTTLPIDPKAETIYSVPSDSLYKLMMQESDNFVAEQLLLVCAGILTDSLRSEIVMDYAKESLLNDLPDEPIWRDGSGLSRYNLFTPRSIIQLWLNIYNMVPQDRLFGLLAAGGESGTIEDWYEGAAGSFVFAKTGTLSNNHSLSGFIRTKKGRILIFSFMHNNFKGSSNRFKVEMENVLTNIYENY